MHSVLVIHASREMHSKLVADRIASELRAAGVDAQSRDLSRAVPPIRFDALAGVVLVAATRGGRHGRQLIRFARAHAPELGNVGSAFASVGPASAEGEDSVAWFIARTGWRPAIAMTIDPGDLATARELAQRIAAIVLRRNGPAERWTAGGRS